MAIRLSEIELDLKILKLKFTREDLEDSFAEVLSEMREIVSNLKASERDDLRRIMESTSEQTVEKLFPSFARPSPALETLRRLRDAQFIRPRRGGRWRADSVVEVKRFGRLMWSKAGEAGLFGD